MVYPLSPDQVLAAQTCGEGDLPYFPSPELHLHAEPAGFSLPPTLGTSLSQLGILKSESPLLPADSYFSVQLLCCLEIILDFDHPSGSCQTPSWPSLSEMSSTGSGALIRVISLETLNSSTASACKAASGSNIQAQVL